MTDTRTVRQIATAINCAYTFWHIGPNDAHVRAAVAFWSSEIRKVPTRSGRAQYLNDGTIPPALRPAVERHVRERFCLAAVRSALTQRHIPLREVAA